MRTANTSFSLLDSCASASESKPISTKFRCTSPSASGRPRRDSSTVTSCARASAAGVSAGATSVVVVVVSLTITEWPLPLVSATLDRVLVCVTSCAARLVVALATLSQWRVRVKG
jgi:hypothetical protein